MKSTWGSGALLLGITAFTGSLFSGFAFAKPLAIVTNGAISIWSNHGRYYRNIKSAGHAFSQWQIANLAADGPQSSGPNSLNHDEHDSYIYDAQGLPIPSRFAPEFNYAGPATFKAIAATLAEGIQQLQPGEPVLLYFTDHGGRGGGPEDRKVCLWGENLSVPQMRSLISMVPTTSKVILINDQCYGGGMLEALWLRDEPKVNACGFAAATTAQLAFGGGGFMGSLDSYCSKAGKRNEACTFQDVYVSLLAQGKWKKQSTPIATSDLFLEKVTRKSRTLDPQGGVRICGNRLERISDPHALSQLNPVLRGKFNLLRNDLQDDLGVLSPTFLTSNNVCQSVSDRLVEELKRKIALEERVLEKLNEEMNSQLRPKLRAAIVDGWLKERGNPKLYQNYSRLKGSLAQLNQAKTFGFAEPGIESKIAQVKSEMQPVENQVNLYLTAIREGGPFGPLAEDFIAYTQEQCDAAASNGCPMSNILEDMDQLEAQIHKQTANLVPAWRFFRDLTAVRGIQILMEAGSQLELNQYSALLDCEQTRIL